MAHELLPLFPLQMVLFPGSKIRLHIFEERYKELINECLASGGEFGINLLHENSEVAKIGCTAVVKELTKQYDDGRMDIVVEGVRRFALDALVESGALYTVGRVEFLASSEETPDPGLADSTVELHNKMVELVYRNARYAVESQPGARNLSFKIAQKAGLELQQRQALLSLDSENDRLHVLHNYFTKVLPRLEELSEVERIIKSDGYVIN